MERYSPFVLASLTINLDSLTSNYHKYQLNFVHSTGKEAIHIQTPHLIKIAFPKCYGDQEGSPRHEKIKRKQEKARSEYSGYSREWYSLCLNPDRYVRGITRKKFLRKGGKDKSGDKVDCNDYLDQPTRRRNQNGKRQTLLTH